MRDEASVMKAWKTHRSPLVSIACIAYNQESYIEEAISGFLSQETDFPFEIILHDDASTDRTRAIIEDYAARYPQIIRPVFQTENQHSQPDKNVQLIAISYAKGEYIALCEGDDCWINPHKLQQQIEALRQHPECGACFHPAIRRCVQHPAKDKIIARHHVGNTIFSPHAVILGAAGFCPTASLVIKKKVFETLPEWFYRVPTGDYFIQMLSSLEGGMYYIDQPMSIYRLGSLGSWSNRFKTDEAYIKTYFEKLLVSLEDMDRHTQGRYHRELSLIMRKLCFSMCRNPLLPLQKRTHIFRQNQQRFPLKYVLLWHLVLRHNLLCRWMHTLRNYMFE